MYIYRLCQVQACVAYLKVRMLGLDIAYKCHQIVGLTLGLGLEQQDQDLDTRSRQDQDV